ncbi:SRPBCC domain-containing protein [Caulobacter sp. UNC358MFTsu5.1]|uniref:SRPBCC domain-containing protein n=1 Tax=Caulobacter sp. UNC358MFTsu5.1 TaxID=1449049 RepID=UPI000689D099|nr:SRPBCC domain-containing protein [Caulobacter sp. UNC358MFTsu5.1]
MTTEAQADRQIIITRQFDAPARIVFLAHSKPEHVKRWFGPVDWPLTTCEMDFRVGGRFHFAMTGPNDEPGPPFGGEYLEIEPDRRIVYTNGFDAPGSPRFVTEVTLEETGGKTTLTQVTTFESKAVRDQYVEMGYAEGTNSAYDQLGDVAVELKG